MHISFATGDSQGFIQLIGKSIVRTYTGNDITYPERLYDAYKKFEFNKLGLIETQRKDEKRFVHPMLTITYPHEWTPSAFKTAVLFYLELLLALDEYGWTLKDALPENILFNKQKPVFIDFFSLVTDEDLEKEEWLPFHEKGSRYSVLETMFVPYMLIPLLCYAEKNFNLGKKILSIAYCNNKNCINPVYLLSKKQDNINLIKNIFKLFLGKQINTASLVKKQINSLLSSDASWRDIIINLHSFVINLDVSQNSSDYTSYYTAKNEHFSFVEPISWKEKQISYAFVLDKYSPRTLLELGANTGWFPLLAAHKGISVIAMDIDVACAEHLKISSAIRNEDILSLWMSFDELTVENFSLDNSGKIQKNPLHIAATKRLQADAVSCLGLLHHLTLGLGKNYDELAQIFASLTNNILILEFVNINDDLVKNNKTFFPCLSNWNENTASKEACIASLKKFFTDIEELPSNPETRRILVCKKIS